MFCNRITSKEIIIKRGIHNYIISKTNVNKKEIRSGQSVKLFYPNPTKRKQVNPRIKVPSSLSQTGVRVNEMNIQMLSKKIYEQVFKEEIVNHNTNFINKCRRTLQEHGIVLKETDYLNDVDFVVPPLKGKDLIEHFQLIAEEQVKPYRDIVNMLLRQIPPKPKRWLMEGGWTRYAEGSKPQSVPYPLEEAIVFDVEVCVKCGKAPTLATAVTAKAWYGWISESLMNESARPITQHHYSLDELIPLESEKDNKEHKFSPKAFEPKIVIGHNVSYDRGRIREQYFLKQTKTRFLDTMSLHVCISGVTSYQRAMLKSDKDDEEDDVWKTSASLNSLTEVHKLYCGTEIKKEARDIFLEGSLLDVKKSFQKVMEYCANDVQATYNVLKQLFPMFLDRFPHPATLAGMLEMGSAYLPINSNWNKYITDSEQTYEDLDIEGRLMLARRADEACHLLHDNKYKEDVWMWDQDWEIKELKLLKASKNKNKQLDSVTPTDNLCQDDIEIDPLEEKFKNLMNSVDFLSNVNSHLPGYPKWYRKLCTKPNSILDWTPGPHLISTSMQVTPKLLRLAWEGYPLHFVRGYGWGFLVPFTVDYEQQQHCIPIRQLLEKCPVSTTKSGEASSDGFATISKDVQDNLARKEYYSKVKQDHTAGLYKGSGIWCNLILEDCCYFLKLPHKDGPSFRVGNPLSKDFLNKFSENVLAGDTESAETILELARKLSYWRNNRDRIYEQMIVWLDETCLPKHLKDGNVYGAIIPQIVVAGTLTRRAMEPTWMTASNAHLERVGSELRTMIQCPPGYKFVGADVDSQELWIASVIGDAHFAKIHGATPLGWMTLSGTKSDGTDMHSITAKAVGISRDHAKVLNYARIYGAGQNFAERLLKQFNPALSDNESRSKAMKMYALTKGKRIYYLKKEFLLDLADQPYQHWHAMQIAKVHGKTLNEMFMKPSWVGGMESAMFNRLEEIANNESPVTPFLECRLSRALEPKNMINDRFLPTRINWVVQSGAVDFLHLMLVCMRWIMKDNVRFCLSFHDEVRYLVPDNLKYQSALALHVTNLLTRAFCSMKLGLNDLPQSVAFFSSVEIDTVLRKESKHDCKTPSNPHGLEKGYGIPNGESLSIYDAIDKAAATNSCWYQFERFSMRTRGNLIINNNIISLFVTGMSRATKRKHVLIEILQDDFSPPTDKQGIVKVLCSRGNNLHEVQDSNGAKFLISMPVKFRKNIWVKRGDYIIMESIEEGDKVKGEMVRPLSAEHIKYFKKDGVWPSGFKDKECIVDDELFENTNRLRISETDDSVNSSDEETNSDNDEDTDESSNSDRE